ncbi:GapS4a family protein [Aeromonas sp. S41-2]|uniref:GapS4a family protein n=1 Tax=Aeromonas sp. S41-2 TaxID=2990502 RepID=UPI0022E747DA|nr:hypothetical protein [Aeromonas sp. S41-2]
MGELSKKIGEHGEKVVRNFITMIGWSAAQDGVSIPCEHGGAHKIGNGDRNTHGIDLFHSVKSQLQDFTLDNIVISVKYTSKPYPNYPTSHFKSHFRDLAHTLECFMLSDFRTINNSDYEMSGIRASREIGVLFWLTNDSDAEQNVIKKIHNIIIEKGLSFSCIYVVDNERAKFIYDSISYIKSSYYEMDVNFHYAFTSSNYSDPQINKFGKVMPVEYLTSDILPFRLIDKNSQKMSFCLSCKDGFSEEAMNRLIYLASDVSQNFTNSFVFLFPDYDPLKHQTIVNRAVQLQGDAGRSLDINVYSFKNTFESLVHGK